MLDTVPGKLGKMHQAIRAVDVDKSAEIREAGHPAGINLADFQFIDDTFLDGLAGFGRDGRARKGSGGGVHGPLR